MIVVSDSSALIIFSQLNQLDVLQVLFGSVLIPPEVHRELVQQSTKLGVADIISRTAQWLRVQAPQVIIPYKGLHPGETAAIALAKELPADFLIIDEKAGRNVAAREHIQTIGTIGILEKAADEELLDLASTFAQLKHFKFHVHQKLLDSRLQAFEQKQALKRKPQS